jgi:hypothetical protein
VGGGVGGGWSDGGVISTFWLQAVMKIDNMAMLEVSNATNRIILLMTFSSDLAECPGVIPNYSAIPC